MAIKKPESMEECIYFTNRSLGEEGRATAWVYRKKCPKCDGVLGKPIRKTGAVDKKADHYECPKCKYQESNEDVEKGLSVEIDYKCPHCGNEGEATTEYERKSFQGVKAYVFECGKCNEKIGITKKLKKTKKEK
jgi:predicted RNA-binding Zn-ribbon protein involved in translation (DUF1610 family)|tara:strand:- start:276 stop:677 length:402 start_codon:yes stop_codon:yes gene_type:complete